MHYLIEQQPVVHQRRTIVDCVTLRGPHLVPDSRHASGELFSPLGLLEGDERALLLSINMLYCTNDTGRTVKFTIDFCFDEKPVDIPASASKRLHPDLVGHVCVTLYPSPAVTRINGGVVPSSHQLIYRANVAALDKFDMIQYAGMEESIRNARSGAALPPSVVPPAGEFEIFLQTDPFLVFLMQKRALFGDEIVDEDIRPLAGTPHHYRVTKRAANRVRSVFNDAVFPLFHYTTAKSLRFRCDASAEGDIFAAADPEASLTVLFQLEYLVIARRDPHFEDTTTRIRLF